MWKSLLALFLVLTPISVFALPGERSGVDKNKMWFVDGRDNKFTIYRNLIEDKGEGRVRAWVETSLPRPRSSAHGMLKSLKSYTEYDCLHRNERTLEIVGYDSAGASLGGNDVDQSSRSIVPGTVGELEFAAVCRFAGYKTTNSFDNNE